MKNISYTLRQIASWTSDDSEVLIPALQRGLVWKPRQVELLWDSILRGFPIGSFMLSDIVTNEGSEKYYLMDGQQRYNAISIGFNTVKDARAVLWIDLLPSVRQNTTRKFWIKVTTIPHPWGFKNDDDANRLNTSEKRKALNEFNLKGNIYNDNFSLTETWPVEANLPIPLYCLLEAAEKSHDKVTFVKEVLNSFNATDFSYRSRFNEKIKDSEEALNNIRDILFPAFKALKDYKITCNHLPKEVMETETIEDSTGQTTLEILFTRLNTGGTTISKDDLNYSAIKAYWPSIKKVNDHLAEKYMNPAKLAMLAFRLAFSNKNDDSLKNEFSIKQIRGFARNEYERIKIENLYNKGNLVKILNCIDKWLGVLEEDDNTKTPALLRTSIARNSPDVYLLLMYFANENLNHNIDLKDNEIKALAFCLHWFTSRNDEKGCVQEIFRRSKEGINLNNIKEGIVNLMHNCQLLHIYNVEELKAFVPFADDSPNWRVWNAIPAPAKEFFNRIFWNGHTEAKEMLLFAERQYINSKFSMYDPARQDMWEDYNRPWDYDHIVARNRIVGQRGEYRDYDKVWLDSIGNFAAISFESNRSKNDGVDFSEYQNNSKSLVYDKDFETLHNNITHDKESSIKFALITYNRFCQIYSKVYEVIDVLFNDTVLSKELEQRKTIYNKIKEKYPIAMFHFAASDDNDYQLEREQDWAREWLGVGIVQGDYMVCLEWPATFDNFGNPSNVEIGIRKALGTNVTEDNLAKLRGIGISVKALNPWWYMCENVNTIDVDEINKRFEYYLNILNQLREHH